MKNIKRKGFTLVELLIVIVVIGILSSMMMMSSTEAVTSAKASNIVSNLRNLKTAALAYYVDHMDNVEGQTNITAGTDKINGVNCAKGTFSKDVAVYLNSDKIAEPGYGVLINDKGEWYVTYEIDKGQNSATEKAGIKTKLAGRAKSVGLCGGTVSGSSNNSTITVNSADVYGASKTTGEGEGATTTTYTAVVAMFVR